MTQAPIRTIRELNERAQLFWARQDGLMQGRLENPIVREAAFAALRTDWEKGVSVRLQKTLEHQLQLSAELYERLPERPDAEIGARYREVQRARARKPRGKVAEDGRTLSQISRDFVLRPEHHDQSTKKLWPHFFAELDRLELDPSEIAHPMNLSKSAYAFCDDKGNERKIAYGRFANIVSRVRQKKKSR